jgi:hypothetical protein
LTPWPERQQEEDRLGLPFDAYLYG